MKHLRIAFIVIVGLFLYTLVLTSVTRVVFTHPDQGARYFGNVSKLIVPLTDISKNIKAYLNPEYLIDNIENGDGFTYLDTIGFDDKSSLLVSYKTERYGGVFELYNIQNGDLIKKWEPDNQKIYGQLFNPLNARKYPKGTDYNNLHPLLQSDSAIIFNVEHAGLVKIDSLGNLVWTNSDKVFHHSIEQDSSGYIYVSTQPFQSRQYTFLPKDYESFKNRFKDDEISKIDTKTGEIISSESVIEILIENGFSNLLLAKGQITFDPIHLNDIQPALYKSKYWDVGDLLVSLRNLSVVFLYRPSTRKILWLKDGPWVNQHDVDFVDSTAISVFSNSVLRLESFTKGNAMGGEMYFSPERPQNEVYLYDFKSDSIFTPYTLLMKNLNINTATAGRSEILYNGDIFIEETNSAKVLIGNSEQLKIGFVRRVNEEKIAHLNWCRIIENH